MTRHEFLWFIFCISTKVHRVIVDGDKAGTCPTVVLEQVTEIVKVQSAVTKICELIGLQTA